MMELYQLEAIADEVCDMTLDDVKDELLEFDCEISNTRSSRVMLALVRLRNAYEDEIGDAE